MKTKFLLSPAYLVSIAALIVGGILAGSRFMVVGWMIFIVGLALNALALVVLANREYLHQAQRVGAVPKVSAQEHHGNVIEHDTAEGPSAGQTINNSATPSGKVTDSYRVFPQKKS